MALHCDANVVRPIVRARHVNFLSGPAGPEGGFSYGPSQWLPGFLAVRFSANAGSRERRYIEDLEATGTMLDFDDVAGEASVPEAMAGLIRPRLGTASGETKGVIASLPLMELPAVPHGRFLAIIFSGDGGWRDIDKNHCAETLLRWRVGNRLGQS